MATNRLTRAVNPGLHMEFYRKFCPTCRRWSFFDGRMGARNHPSSCSHECERRRVQMITPRNLERVGAKSPFIHAPSIGIGKTS